MKVLSSGLMVTGKTDDGLERELSLISEYKGIPLRTPNLDKSLVNTAKEFKPDIIFLQLQRAGIVSIDTFRELSEMGCKVINWTGDVRTPIPQFYFDYAPYCITAFSNYTDVLDMREYGYRSDFLQIGYDEKIFKPLGTVRDLDIVFMGNNYHEHKFPLSKYRIEMVNCLKREFSDRFKVFGNGWTYNDGSYNNRQPDENILYNRTKIAINLSHFDYFRYSSDRLFRLTGSGTFCLSHNFKGIESDWEVGEELDVWNDIDELIEKCHFYLKEEKRREEIASLGLKKAQTKFTYTQMAQNILIL